jgi:hypothetical protein
MFRKQICSQREYVYEGGGQAMDGESGHVIEEEGEHALEDGSAHAMDEGRIYTMDVGGPSGEQLGGNGFVKDDEVEIRHSKDFIHCECNQCITNETTTRKWIDKRILNKHLLLKK